MYTILNFIVSPSCNVGKLYPSTVDISVKVKSYSPGFSTLNPSNKTCPDSSVVTSYSFPVVSSFNFNLTPSSLMALLLLSTFTNWKFIFAPFSSFSTFISISPVDVILALSPFVVLFSSISNTPLLSFVKTIFLLSVSNTYFLSTCVCSKLIVTSFPEACVILNVPSVPVIFSASEESLLFTIDVILNLESGILISKLSFCVLITFKLYVVFGSSLVSTIALYVVVSLSFSTSYFTSISLTFIVSFAFSIFIMFPSSLYSI